MNHRYKLGLLAIPSALLSSYFFTLDPPIGSYFVNTFYFFVPGLVFGALLALYFFRFSDREYSLLLLLRGVLLVIFSAAAFWTAVSVVAKLGNTGLESGLISGFIGALMLLLAMHFTIYRLGVERIVLFSILGAVLGIALKYELGIELLGKSGLGVFPIAGLEFPILFLVWQVGMAVALGSVLEKQLAGEGAVQKETKE